MHFPAAADKKRPQAMHDSCQHTVKQYRRSERDFNLPADHLHGKRIQQNAGE